MGARVRTDMSGCIYMQRTIVLSHFRGLEWERKGMIMVKCWKQTKSCSKKKKFAEFQFANFCKSASREFHSVGAQYSGDLRWTSFLGRGKRIIWWLRCGIECGKAGTVLDEKVSRRWSAHLHTFLVLLSYMAPCPFCYWYNYLSWLVAYFSVAVVSLFPCMVTTVVDAAVVATVVVVVALTCAAGGGCGGCAAGGGRGSCAAGGGRGSCAAGGGRGSCAAGGGRGSCAAGGGRGSCAAGGGRGSCAAGGGRGSCAAGGGRGSCAAGGGRGSCAAGGGCGSCAAGGGCGSCAAAGFGSCAAGGGRGGCAAGGGRGGCAAGGGRGSCVAGGGRGSCAAGGGRGSCAAGGGCGSCAAGGGCGSCAAGCGSCAAGGGRGSCAAGGGCGSGPQRWCWCCGRALLEEGVCPVVREVLLQSGRACVCGSFFGFIFWDDVDCVKRLQWHACWRYRLLRLLLDVGFPPWNCAVAPGFSGSYSWFLLFVVAGEVTAAWRTRVESLESPHLRDLAESLPTVLASEVAGGGRAGSGRACGVRVGGGCVGGGRAGGGRVGGGRVGGGRGGGGRLGGGRVGGGRVGGGPGSGGRGSYPQRWYWRCREAILKEEVHHGSWIISACWRVSSPLCPVALTERFWKEGRCAGHAHLLGKVVTRGKKGRSYIHGSITFAREPEAVCKAESPVRLKCASMACTVYLLVECPKRQEYQTTWPSGTMVGEVIKWWLHTWGNIAQLDACVAVAAASVNVCLDVSFIPSYALSALHCWRLARCPQLVCLLPLGASG